MAAELQWHSRVREKGSHVAFCPLRAAAAHWEQAGGGGERGGAACPCPCSTSWSKLRQAERRRDVTHFEDLP